VNTKDFLRLGVPLGEATRRATDFVAKFILGGGDKSRLHEEVAAIVANPSAYVDDPLRGGFAKALRGGPRPIRKCSAGSQMCINERLFVQARTRQASSQQTNCDGKNGARYIYG
jgi:hypothetical protein